MIEMHDVSYGYGAAPLLEGVNLHLTPGSFHFLTGPSGAGKTTLLKLCHAALFPTQGATMIFGQNSAHLSRDHIARARQRIGIVQQDCQFLDHLSVRDNIMLPLTVSGRTSPAQEKNLAELLVWVGLVERATALPPHLSGGERQRAALARALMTDPDVILADEPTGNIDWDMSLRLMKLVIQLNQMGKTVLIATHDLALIRATKPHVAARVLRIAGRTLHAAGSDL